MPATDDRGVCWTDLTVPTWHSHSVSARLRFSTRMVRVQGLAPELDGRRFGAYKQVSNHVPGRYLLVRSSPSWSVM